MAWLLLIGILLTLAFLFLYTARNIFRDGSNAHYLNRFPVKRALFYTFGLALFIAGMEWITDKPDPLPLKTSLPFAGVCFLIGSSLWLTGFFFGRWRTAKHRGVISGR